MEPPATKIAETTGDPTTGDPVGDILLRGEAETLHEAEEKYLDASMPEIIRLMGSDLSNEELERHPLIQLVLSHGSRGWEDSLL
ncbi:MAG: hypothetical protein HYS13_08005 [Planctomycetia bacterium]|nr:hypothetical protein [Planctomycetia bacterium]